LGGHLVTGHVDAIAEILSIKKEGDSKKFTFLLPNHLKKFVAAKGSITLNGASLTVNEINEDGKGRTVFGVNIIPHTQEKTTFGSLTEGEFVNVEIDILARYVARMREVD
jgi:riboflavin synthase